MAIIVKPKYTIEESPCYSLTEIKKAIERAGRTCYRSEGLITETSHLKFVESLVKSGHGAMLEHGTVYLHFPYSTSSETEAMIYRFSHNPYSTIHKVQSVMDDVNDTSGFYVTTNFRVLVENNWLEYIDYICEQPTQYHDKRYTVRFTLQLVIEREYNRHRTHSLGSESTRFCNYNLDKYGNEITICQPDNVTDEDIAELQEGNDFWGYIRLLNDISNCKEDMDERMKAIDWWWFANLATEISYLNLVRLGWRPEQARTILPLDLKCESVHTAFKKDWISFFKLRSYISPSNKPHPDAIATAKPLMDEFIKRGFISEDELK